MAPVFITVDLQRPRTSSLPYRTDNSGIRARCRIIHRMLRSTGTVNTPATLTTPATSATLAHIRACLMLRVFALSRQLLARLRRANNGVWCVEPAHRAGSTHHTPSGERRRREQASAMAIRQTLTHVRKEMQCRSFYFMRNCLLQNLKKT